jgi:hypothetical protein
MAGEGEGVGDTHRARTLAAVRMPGGWGSEARRSEPIEKVKPGLPDLDFSELNLRPKFVWRF